VEACLVGQPLLRESKRFPPAANSLAKCAADVVVVHDDEVSDRDDYESTDDE
jgi:hypothetical protein